MGIETALLVASVAGTAMTAYGQIQQGEAAQKAAEYNAEVANMQAKDAINRGNIEAEKQRLKAQQVAGAQRAAMGASGAQVDSGSFADILLDTATTGEKDAQTIRTNAMRQAWGLESQAEIDLYQGKQAKQAAYMQAGGTLLTGTATAASRMGWGSSSSIGGDVSGTKFSATGADVRARR